MPPAYQYLHYLPTWNPEERYPPLEPFEHYEHGKDADPSFPNLLPPGTSVTDLTPTIGSEVKGIQLSSLSDAGKDELALYVAQRKLVHRGEGDKAKEEMLRSVFTAKATHSGIEQVNAAAIRASIKRRARRQRAPDCADSSGNGEKALFVNDHYTRDFRDEKEESDAILQFLYNHMAVPTSRPDQVGGGTVVVWDNRVQTLFNHSAYHPDHNT
ncbi:uncharacterized protein HRG_11980 [Hirsutella rhossiliensis]|uniref:Alpha-ketoglutarate-dependent taurine dioxygenase n=1 Tax=Hirsutella rhossiliensis TaxID=111463 RepID=A0A9P8SCI8_9HYPO|nr:uncharacterized protein HRG_11980 [Hirsutella rhossiliensis]KAH0956944.1 hypothetical protein HRG_11980 [Hirsutella rhossiliensis]